MDSTQKSAIHLQLYILLYNGLKRNLSAKTRFVYMLSKIHVQLLCNIRSIHIRFQSINSKHVCIYRSFKQFYYAFGKKIFSLCFSVFVRFAAHSPFRLCSLVLLFLLLLMMMTLLLPFISFSSPLHFSSAIYYAPYLAFPLFVFVMSLCLLRKKKGDHKTIQLSTHTYV